KERVLVPIGETLYVGEPMIALVRDTSLFGATSPILGNRSRVEFDQSVGDLTYSSLLLDYRQYWMPKRPYTIAVRAVHFGRYGQDAESPYMVDYYAGYPELVRGYNLSGTDATGCGQP